jgi:TetR/AcrR family transcriptional regulator, transcriptional repressor for nem operon
MPAFPRVETFAACCREGQTRLTKKEYGRNLFHMRYPVEQKAETHTKIIDAAARSFREHGAEGNGNGIGSVMKELGLTKGGFYRHFDSKDDLFAESVAYAFQGRGATMVAWAEAAPKGEGLRAIIEHYLTAEHLGAPGSACLFVTLGPELARQSKAVRKRINQSLAAYRDRLLPFVPGSTRDEKIKTFGILFPSMAGVLTVARTIDDVETRERMLAGAREFFINTFAGKTK